MLENLAPYTARLHLLLRDLRGATRRSAPADPVESTGADEGSVIAAGVADPGPGCRDRRVVILADSSTVFDVHRLIQSFDAAAVYVMAGAALNQWNLAANGAAFRPASNLPRIKRQLRMVGPVDVIVDLRVENVGPGTWRDLFFNLRSGGTYIVPSDPRLGGVICDEVLGSLAGFPDSTMRPTAAPAGANEEILSSVSQFTVNRQFLTVVKQGNHYLKLREEEVARALPQRNSGTTVSTLKRLPAGEYRSSAAVISHGSTPPPRVSTTLEYPELSLQLYTGRIAAVSNQLLFTDGSILPASYRYPTVRKNTNPRIKEVQDDFVTIPDEYQPQKTLRGTYYHLDCWYSGHFGHIMSEVTPRLWGWHIAKQIYPDLKALFRLRWPNERQPAIEYQLFRRFGIRDEDIVTHTEPVWLESVVTATPAWQNADPYFVHPAMRDVAKTLQSSLTGSGSGVLRDIFISRRSGQENRHCRNARDVESFFESAGFEVIYPEEYELDDQAKIFASARQIAGFAGSAMFSLVYAKHASRIIVLAHEAYTARYEQLLAMTLGCEAHYFWSAPDTVHPDGSWSSEAYFSPWEFDFGRHRDSLGELLSREPQT